jgi:hypothetical protein
MDKKPNTHIMCCGVSERERERDLFLENRVVLAAVLGFIGAKDGFFLFFFWRERERVLAEKTVEMEGREGGCESDSKSCCHERFILDW